MPPAHEHSLLQSLKFTHLLAPVLLTCVSRALAALARSSMSSDPDDLTLVSQLMAVAATTLDRCDVGFNSKH